jgi:hypothetical protein
MCCANPSLRSNVIKPAEVGTKLASFQRYGGWPVFFPAGRKCLLCTGVLALLLLTTSCSIFNPHVMPVQKHPWMDSTRYSGQVSQQPSDKEPQELAGGMVEAISYANSWRTAYYNAVGNQSKLRSSIALALIPTAAAALFEALTGGPTKAIAGLSISGAGIYALGTYFDNRQLQRIYLLGSEAMGCAILSMRPFMITNESYTSLQQALRAIPGQISTVHEKIGAVQEQMRGVGAGAAALTQADQSMKGARALVDRASVALANGQLMVDNMAQASLTLVTNVDNIRDRVSLELTRQEASLQSLTTLVSSLGGLAADFTPTQEQFPALESRIKPHGRKFDRELEVALALRHAVTELDQASSDLLSLVLIVEERQKRVESARSNSGSRGSTMRGQTVLSRSTLPLH